MDIQEYILSGTLELYVLGQLTDEENRQVQELAMQYPEIKKEIENIEDSLHVYALEDTKPLDPALKQKTLSKIFPKENFNERKVIHLKRTSDVVTYLVAASVTVLMLIGAAYLFLWEKSSNRENNNTASIVKPSEKIDSPQIISDSAKVIQNGNLIAITDSNNKKESIDKNLPAGNTGSQTKDFVVVHVEGSIINKHTGKPIKLGEKIEAQDEIEFKEKEAQAVVMDQKTQRYKLDDSKLKAGNYIAMVDYVVDPLKGNSLQNFRGGDEEAIIDLTGYFGNDKFCIVGDRSFIKINRDNFPMSEATYFMYSYSNNGKTINKKIPYKNDTLFLDKKILFSGSETNEVGEKATIYYQDLELKSSTPITRIKLLFLPEKTIRNEFKVQIDLFKNMKMSNEKIKHELYKHIVDVYGKTDRAQLESWIEKNFPNLR